MRHEPGCHIYVQSKAVCYVLFFWDMGIVIEGGAWEKNFCGILQLCSEDRLLNSGKSGWEEHVFLKRADMLDVVTFKIEHFRHLAGMLLQHRCQKKKM